MGLALLPRAALGRVGPSALPRDRPRLRTVPDRVAPGNGRRCSASGLGRDGADEGWTDRRHFPNTSGVMSMRRYALALVTVVVAAAAAIACGGGDPEPGAVRLAVLTAGAAADVLSDLAAVDDPDAAGVRDAFHAANVTALDNARLAHESAPRATRAAYALSLEAAENADAFAEALGAAIEARDELAAQAQASRAASEAAGLIGEIVRRRADDSHLEAVWNRALRRAERFGDDDPKRPPRFTEEYTEYLAQWNAAVDRLKEAGRRRTENTLKLASAELQLSVLDLGAAPRLGGPVADKAGAETVAEAEAEAETLAETHAVTLADTAAKVRVAEERHPAAITAYRAAASAWRALLESGKRQ